jgi:hypothetical protein
LDKHGVADYEDALEPVELDVDARRRHFGTEVDKESVLALPENHPPALPSCRTSRTEDESVIIVFYKCTGPLYFTQM